MSKKSDYWAKHIAAIEESGMDAAQYAREHNLDPRDIYRWRYVLKMKTNKLQAKTELAQSGLRGGFVSLQVEQSQARSAVCSIKLANDVVLDLYSLPDPRWLADVVCATRG